MGYIFEGIYTDKTKSQRKFGRDHSYQRTDIDDSGNINRCVYGHYEVRNKQKYDNIFLTIDSTRNRDKIFENEFKTTIEKDDTLTLYFKDFDKTKILFFDGEDDIVQWEYWKILF